MNKILILICLEAKEPKTEKEFFKSLVDKNKDFIKIQYLDKESKSAEDLSKINILKLNEIIKTEDLKTKKYLEIICFCDGDVDEKQIISIKRTSILIENYVKNKTKIEKIDTKLLYDKGHSFEFFIWHITNKFDYAFYLENRNNLNSLKNKYIFDVIEIYKEININITDISKFKKYSKIIWKPIVELYKKNNDRDHIKICETILNKFDKNMRFSVYFEIIEKILEYYKLLYEKWEVCEG